MIHFKSTIFKFKKSIHSHIYEVLKKCLPRLNEDFKC